MFQSLFKSRQKESVTQIPPSELQARRNRGDGLYLVDVRTPQEFASGHIEGARLLPLQNLATRLNEIPQNKTVVCICQSGRRSRAACEQLQAAGFDDILNLRGGMMAWQMSGLPTGA